ncbi:hypothetical protein KKB83_05760 [Patescibacteria group bacterium]|nr:hypothetical protein [Patescibacteria group bacterium]
MAKVELRFSEEELHHLIRAWLAISLAFAIVFARDYPGFGALPTFGLSSLTVGLSFIIHELAHKFVAQKYGCWAEFRSFDLGLVLAVIMAFVGGFVFAAPGAVMISGMVDEEENGKIAAVGPMTNLALALVFTGLAFVLRPVLLASGNSFAIWIMLFLLLGRSINSWLALFNLLPFGIMDGFKIQRWNPRVWLALIAVSVILVFA